MIDRMKKPFVSITSLFLLGSLFGQPEQPEIRTLDSKFAKETQCLNPEYLLFSASKTRKDKLTE